MIRRRHVLPILLATAAGARLRGAVAQDAAGPAEPVRALAAALEKLPQSEGGMAQRVATLSPVIQRAFALPTILAATIGPRFASFPPADQAALLDVFTRYTVVSYAANFAAGSNRVTIDPGTRTVGADRVVGTEVQQNGGEATRVDYQVRQLPAGWQVVDVLLDGSISQVAVQRSDFRSLVRGDSLAPLIERLRGKTAALEAGEKG